MWICKYCNEINDNKVSNCSFCGCGRYKNPQKVPVKALAVIAIIAIAVIIVALVCYRNSDDTTDNQTITAVTPDVIPAITPDMTPEVASIVTPAATPTVTPEATPAVTSVVPPEMASETPTIDIQDDEIDPNQKY